AVRRRYGMEEGGQKPHRRCAAHRFWKGGQKNPVNPDEILRIRSIHRSLGLTSLTPTCAPPHREIPPRPPPLEKGGRDLSRALWKKGDEKEILPILMKFRRG